jgi:hypothetical protein
MATFFVILVLTVVFGSAVALALVQNARDADEEWEEAIRKEQSKK